MLIIIARSPYGIKSYGATWRGKLAEILMLLGYKSSEVGTGLYMKQYFKPNVDPYYKYIICYVDELLHIGFNPREEMDALNIIYRLKEAFVPPDRYLGANVEKVHLKDGRVV